MSILATLVIEKNARCTEVSDIHGRPLEIARALAHQLDLEDGNKSLDVEGYVYNVKIADEVVYLCVSDKKSELKLRSCFLFLIAIKKEYEEQRYEQKKDKMPFELFIRSAMVRKFLSLS